MARLVEIGLVVLGGGTLLLAKLGALDGAASWVAPQEEPQQLTSASDPWSEGYDPQAAAPSVFYRNCDAARAAGAAPVRRGDPGYAAHLDRDGDGAGCEPYYGR